MPVTTFLLLGATLALAGGSKAERIAELAQAGKLDKARELCQRLDRDRGLQSDEAEACAAAALKILHQRVPGPGADELDAFEHEWLGTAAARQAHEEAARLRFRAATVDPSHPDLDALYRLVQNYGDTEEAGRALDVLLEAAAAQGSEALERFARENAGTPQAERAHQRARELAWKEAEAAGTAQAWRALLRRYPDHPRADEARRREEALAFREAAQDGSAAALRALLDAYPQHPRRAEAERMLVDALYREAEAEGPLALLAVVRDHPEHPLAAIKREQALKAALRVKAGPNLVVEGDGSGPPAGTPLAEGAQEPVLVQEPVTRLEVQLPDLDPPLPGPPPEARLFLVREGSYADFGAAYSAALRELGVSAGEAGLRAAASWTQPDPLHLVGSFPEPLCQVPGEGVRYELVLRYEPLHEGEPPLELHYPFRVAAACGD